MIWIQQNDIYKLQTGNKIELTPVTISIVLKWSRACNNLGARGFSCLISDFSQDCIDYELFYSFAAHGVGLWPMPILRHARTKLFAFHWVQLWGVYISNVILVWVSFCYDLAISFCIYLLKLLSCAYKFHSETKWFKTQSWSLILHWNEWSLSWYFHVSSTNMKTQWSS